MNQLFVDFLSYQNDILQLSCYASVHHYDQYDQTPVRGHPTCSMFMLMNKAVVSTN